MFYNQRVRNSLHSPLSYTKPARKCLGSVGPEFLKRPEGFLRHLRASESIEVRVSFDVLKAVMSCSGGYPFEARE